MAFGADQSLSIVIKARDEASAVFNSVQKSAANLGDRFKAAEGASLAFAAGLAASTAAVGYFGYSAVKAAQQQEDAQARLAHILKTSRQASDESIASLIKQADALEKVGVVSGDMIVQAQGTLATFDLQAESIRTLVPAFLDMVVAEKGVNASMDDMTSYANALGAALQGNYAALTKRGFILDEDTKLMIENGTESQRIDAITKVLNSTYEGLNQTMRSTSQGGMKGVQMSLERITQNIGTELLPVINNLVGALDSFTQNQLPALIAGIERTVHWFSEHRWALYVVAGAIVGALVPAIYMATAAFAALVITLAPFIIGGAIIGGIVAGIMWIIKHWDLIRAKASETWEGVASVIRNAWQGIADFVMEKVQAVIDAYNRMISVVSKPFTFAGGVVSGATGAVGNFFQNLPRFEQGGIVPGAAGQAVPIIAHGQERVVPAGASSSSGGITINFNNVSVRNDADVRALRAEFEGYFRQVLMNRKLAI